MSEPRVQRIAARRATILWEGEVIVVGGSLAGLECAGGAARSGLRTCLIEPGPLLAGEISAMWATRPPSGPIGERLAGLCAEMGGAREGRVDPLVAALAADQIPEQDGFTAFVRVLPLRVYPAGGGLALEVVGKSGRQQVRGRHVILAGSIPGPLGGRTPEQSVLVERRILLAGAGEPREAREFVAPAALGLRENRIRTVPGVWPGETFVIIQVELPAGAADSQRYFRSQEAAFEAAAWLRSSQPEFAESFAVGISPEPRVLGEPDAPGLRGYSPATPGALPGALRNLPVSWRTVEPDSPGASAGTPGPVVSSELAAALEWDLPETELPPLEVQMHSPCDVVVCGYGVAGAFAALAAASHGLRVAVLDPSPYPGGIGTAGNIHSYYFGIKSGMQTVLDERMAGAAERVAGNRYRGFHPLAKSQTLALELQARGIETFPGFSVFGVVRENDRIRAVLAAGDSGVRAFPCRVAVDATGDGDLAAAAGAPFRFGRDGDGFPQPFSYTPSYLDRGKLWHRNFDAGWVDPTDTLAYSRAHFEGRRRIREQAPFTPERHYCTLAPLLGIRESRFIRGRAEITFEDILEGRQWHDAVCEVEAHYDNHAMDYANESDWGRRHVTYFGLWRRHFRGQIPFGILVPRGVRDLLVACRAVSTDHDCHQLFRMQRDMQQVGEIAGHIAAHAVRLGLSPDALDDAEIQRILDGRGLLPGAAPEPQADLPPAELLEHLRDPDSRGIAMWRLVRIREAAPIDWEAFLGRENDDAARFCAALCAVLRGDPAPAAESLLRDAAKDRRPQPVLGEKAPPAFLAAAMALAEDRRAGAADILGEILQGAELEPWDILLALRGLELAGDPGGVPWVKRFLEHRGGESFAAPMWGCAPEWTTSFQPQIEMRAVHTLIALGDRSETGRLLPYASHPNLLFRRYARRLLRRAGIRAGAPD